MIPSWLVTTLVFTVGCILAIVIGTVLPAYGYLSLYIVITSIVCLLAIRWNNAAALLSLALWFPIPAPIPVLKSLPLVSIALIWSLIILFFKICQSRRLEYVPAFNLFMLVGFIWVPIRFLLSPVDKLGASAGGSGVSGAAAYLGYFLATAIVFVLGSVINTKEKVYVAMIWSYYATFWFGLVLLICSFIPATLPLLSALGMFVIDGGSSLRIVAVSMYGLFLMGAGLTPRFFRFSNFWGACVFILGTVLVIDGQNRSTAVAALILIPVTLIVKRSLGGLILFVVLSFFGFITAFSFAQNMTEDQSQGAGRILGLINPKVDEMSGGSASAEWRYDVWKSAQARIGEHPFIGKGFGNLPKTIDPGDSGGIQNMSDFEVVIAAGMEHNGYLVAAYGFGIPFAAILVAALVYEILSNLQKSHLVRDGDPSTSDFCAFIAGLLSSFLMLVYTASDLAGTLIWYYACMGVIYKNLSSTESVPEVLKPPFSAGVFRGSA